MHAGSPGSCDDSSPHIIDPKTAMHHVDDVDVSLAHRCIQRNPELHLHRYDEVATLYVSSR